MKHVTKKITEYIKKSKRVKIYGVFRGDSRRIICIVYSKGQIGIAEKKELKICDHINNEKN